MLTKSSKRLTMGTTQTQITCKLLWVCGVTFTALFCTITFSCFP